MLGVAKMLQHESVQATSGSQAAVEVLEWVNAISFINETTTVTSETTEATNETTVESTEVTTEEQKQTSKVEKQSTVQQAQQTEQQSVAEKSTYAPAKEVHYNQIEYLGYFFNVGPVFAPNFRQPSAIHALANYIDGGGIGAIGSPLDVYDGQGTYIAGHNPGVMSLFAANLGHGSVVTVHDANGNTRNYVVTSSTSMPINNNADYSNTSRSDRATSNFVNQIQGNETLIIQFCIGQTLCLFKLDPM